MKKLLNYFLVMMLLPALVLTSCKDDNDTDPQVGDFATLSAHMINSGYDLPALLEGWVIDPKPLTVDGGIVDVDNDCTIPGWTVFDIRNEEDFNKGHIKGSFNVSLQNIVTEAQAINGIDKILVVCYSGQTAGRAVMALRLSGFPNAKVMKFGFSAWSDNSEFDKWSGKTANIAVGSPNWVTTVSPELPVNGLPTWTTTATEGADILALKVTEMLAGEGWGVKSDLVLNAPADYSIYNFWKNADYIGYGHYTGAYEYKPISLADDIVKAMNPENDNLIYCYTGQTSSFIVAWLNVLGYNAKSILNGVNSLSYDALVAGESPHWHFPYHEYTYEVTE